MNRVRYAGVLLLATAVVVGNGLLASDLLPALPHVGEGWHIAGHVLVFGVVGAATSRYRPWSALLAWLGFGLAIEVAQSLGISRFFWREIAFDSSVNLVAGMMGRAMVQPDEMAKQLGTWLHPGCLLPLTLLGMGWSLNTPMVGLSVATRVMICLAPALVWWIVGVRAGWYETVDIRDRTRRPPLFLIASVCSLLMPWWIVEPTAFHTVALGISMTVIGVTLITISGFKISGHVTGALVPAVAMVPFSWRGALVLLLCGVLLSWARVRAQCHTRAQVAGAWGLAAVVAWVMLR